MFLLCSNLFTSQHGEGVRSALLHNLCTIHLNWNGHPVEGKKRELLKVKVAVAATENNEREEKKNFEAAVERTRNERRKKLLMTESFDVSFHTAINCHNFQLQRLQKTLREKSSSTSFRFLWSFRFIHQKPTIMEATNNDSFKSIFSSSRALCWHFSVRFVEIHAY